MPDLSVWAVALLVLLGLVGLALTIPRVIGPRSWGPIGTTGLFLVLYVVAVGGLMYVHVVVLDGADGKFQDLPWKGLGTFYWPAWVGTFAPTVAFGILGVHLWRPRSETLFYALILLVVVAGVHWATDRSSGVPNGSMRDRRSVAWVLLRQS